MKVSEVRAVYDEHRLPVLEEVRSYNFDGRKPLNNSGAVAEFLENMGLHRCAEERMMCVVLKQNMVPEAVFCVGQGTVSETVVDVRGLFQKVLMFGSKNIIIAHNHPSGDVSPSMDDWATMNKIEQGCGVLGLNLLDSVIIGENRYQYTSMKGERK